MSKEEVILQMKEMIIKYEYLSMEYEHTERQLRGFFDGKAEALMDAISMINEIK